MQAKNYDKKVATRDKLIEGLEAELVTEKDNFADFKKNSTIDAYFKKYDDVVRR